MPTDEVKNEILEGLAEKLKVIEKTYLGNEDFEVTVTFPDEAWEWNLTGWGKIK